MLLGVEVDHAPVLQEAMQPQDAADVAGNLLTALGARQVGLRVLTIQFDDEVPLLEVRLGIFVRELPTEVLWQRRHFEFVDLVESEPGRAARDDYSAPAVLLAFQLF